MSFVFQSKYKAALEQYKLKSSDLNEDAQAGIAGIDEILRAISILEKKGRKPQDRTVRKLNALDKWVYFEILDQVQDTDENDDVPLDSKQVKEEVDKVKKEAEAAAAAAAKTATASAKTNDDSNEAPDPEGVTIEAELEKMFATNRKDWDIESINPVAPTTYNVLFDSYEKGKENGVKTSKYSLIETSEKTFTLTQN